MRRLNTIPFAIRQRRVTVTIAATAAIAGLALAANAGPITLAIAGVASVATFIMLRATGKLEAGLRALAGAGAPSDVEGLLDALEVRLHAAADREAKLHPVTGIATREPLAQTINAEIAAACGERLLAAIRLADYDRLAAFDLYAANAVLADFGARLVRAANPEVTIAQIDRDTFALWFAGTGDPSAEFRAIVYVASQDIPSSAGSLAPSIEAAAVRYPLDGTDAANLFVRLTSALNAAPRAVGGAPRVATAAPTDSARSHFMLEQDLNHAIEEGQLKMMFQPVVDVARRRLIGAEALLRWDHPQLGAVSPAQFIPMVEASGLSDRFGLWVLNAACSEARLWSDTGRTDLKVAVNLSARQLDDDALIEKIERTLHRHGLRPAALELELTETAAMTEAERTFDLFSKLRTIGVSLAIDDFGAGYSSMSYLKNLPFDKLKIDREFITEVDSRRDSRAICRALIELSKGLDLLVLAEGVETQAEVDTLHQLGCDVFQGYYFSKPLTGDAFRRLVSNPTSLFAAAAPQRAAS